MFDAVGKFGRLIAVRFEPEEDIYLKLLETCKRHGILNGVIVTGIGSLKKARFLNPIPLPHKKAGYGYSDVIELDGPIELISMNGMISHENSEVLIHVHCSFSDSEGNGYGGHLIEGNIVLLTTDIIITEIKGIDMTRKVDAELGVPIFKPIQL